MLGVPLVLIGGLITLIVVNNRARARGIDRTVTKEEERADRDDRDAGGPPLAKAS